jgi:hypothetical protein
MNKREQEPILTKHYDLDILFAAELFSKLSEEEKSIIIEQIKDLLSLKGAD